MKVSELIELLGDENPEAEIRVGYQPNYPLVGLVGGVTTSYEMVNWARGEADAPDDLGQAARIYDDHEKRNKIIQESEYLGDEEKRNLTVCWIVMSEGTPYDENPYAPRSLWEMN